MFLDTEKYLDNGKLCINLYRKETEWQHYLYIKSKHPKLLKDTLQYNQAIQIKGISSKQEDFNNSLKEMKNNFVKQGYHPSLIKEHRERISLLNKIDLIKEKDTL